MRHRLTVIPLRWWISISASDQMNWRTTVARVSRAPVARYVGRGAAPGRLTGLVVAFIAAFIANVQLSATASAQPAFTLPPPPFTVPFLPSPSGLWTVSVGVGGDLKPDFEGAKRYTPSPVPIFNIRRAGSPDRFRSPRDGASIALLDYGGFRAGPVGKYKSARTAANFTELNGLGDVKFAIELGGFAEYFPTDWFRARVEVRQGFIGHNGVVADFSADAIVPVTERITVSAGPRFTLESAKATAPYFSITPAQAMASGLPAFNAAGGSHAVGAGTQLRYQITPRWEAHYYVEYDRLLGGAAASPLVQLRGSPNQVTVGLGASYSFDVGVR
jgi:outer membrane protein